jgi:hypothetical protein
MSLNTGSAHRTCMVEGKHVCQEPSGRTCVESGCDQDAGTWWGPYWCPDCDKERLDRISSLLDEIAASFGETP